MGEGVLQIAPIVKVYLMKCLSAVIPSQQDRPMYWRFAILVDQPPCPVSLSPNHRKAMNNTAIMGHTLPFHPQPINCIKSPGGHLVCAKLKHRLILCNHFLVPSSLIICAAPLSLSCNFSRALRS